MKLKIYGLDELVNPSGTVKITELTKVIKVAQEEFAKEQEIARKNQETATKDPFLDEMLENEQLKQEEIKSKLNAINYDEALSSEDLLMIAENVDLWYEMTSDDEKAKVEDQLFEGQTEDFKEGYKKFLEIFKNIGDDIFESIPEGEDPILYVSVHDPKSGKEFYKKINIEEAQKDFLLQNENYKKNFCKENNSWDYDKIILFRKQIMSMAKCAKKIAGETDEVDFEKFKLNILKNSYFSNFLDISENLGFNLYDWFENFKDKITKEKGNYKPREDKSTFPTKVGKEVKLNISQDLSFANFLDTSESLGLDSLDLFKKNMGKAITQNDAYKFQKGGISTSFTQVDEELSPSDIEDYFGSVFEQTDDFYKEPEKTEVQISSNLEIQAETGQVAQESEKLGEIDSREKLLTEDKQVQQGEQITQGDTEPEMTESKEIPETPESESTYDPKENEVEVQQNPLKKFFSRIYNAVTRKNRPALDAPQVQAEATSKPRAFDNEDVGAPKQTKTARLDITDRSVIPTGKGIRNSLIGIGDSFMKGIGSVFRSNKNKADSTPIANRAVTPRNTFDLYTVKQEELNNGQGPKPIIPTNVKAVNRNTTGKTNSDDEGISFDD